MNYGSIDPTPKRADSPAGENSVLASSPAAVENVAVEETPVLLLPSSPTSAGYTSASRKLNSRDHEDEGEEEQDDLRASKSQDAPTDGDGATGWHFFLRIIKTTIFERNFGLFLVLLAQFFAGIMALTTRLLETRYTFHPLQILFVRMFITSACSLAYMWWKSVPDFPLGAKSVRGLLVLRGCAGFIGVFGLYYSLAYLHLADAIVITFLVPTVASLGCWMILHEPFTRSEAFAGAIAFLGVLFIARPPFLFPTSPDSPKTPGLPEVTPAQRLIAVSLALVGIFGAATAYTTIRCIGHRCQALISVNYFAVVTTVVSFVVIMLHPDLSFKIPVEPMEWTLLTVIGFTGFVMQFLLTAGLQREKASRATNMVYTQLIFALIFERWVFGTVPAWQSVVGCGLILVAAIWVATQKSKSLTESSPRPADNDEERALLPAREENS